MMLFLGFVKKGENSEYRTWPQTLLHLARVPIHQYPLYTNFITNLLLTYYQLITN